MTIMYWIAACAESGRACDVGHDLARNNVFFSYAYAAPDAAAQETARLVSGCGRHMPSVVTLKRLEKNGDLLLFADNCQFVQPESVIACYAENEAICAMLEKIVPENDKAVIADLTAKGVVVTRYDRMAETPEKRWQIVDYPQWR